MSELEALAAPLSPVEGLVLTSTVVNFEYPLGKLDVEATAGGPSVRVVFVADLEGKILVAVPSSAWHRLTAKRVLGAGSFAKPVHVSLAGCVAGDRTDPTVGELRVWMGFLDPVLVDQVVEVSPLGEVDYDFEDGLLPYAGALKELATEHFSFFSAGEAETEENVDTQPKGRASAAGSRGDDVRLTKLEETMAQLSASMKTVLEQTTAAKAAAPTSTTTWPRTSALRTPRVRFDPSVTKPAAIDLEEYPDLDGAVVQAAITAGVDRHSLEEMQKLVSKNKKGARPLRQHSPSPMTNPLSDTEEDPGQEQEECGSPGGSGDPVPQALARLTEIVEHLTANKSKGNKLDLALDGAGTSSADSSLGGSVGKRAAAARRYLRTALRESPVDIYTLIEKLMEEDIQSQSTVPGMSSAPTSARSWMEHRSRIGAYKSMAHSGWGVAGIIDALRAGQISQARARANLLLLQLDQASADRGSWALAQDLSLELPPPFSVLSTHQAPDVNSGELPFSRLLDPRWAEITMSFLRDQDQYVNHRRTLGRSTTGKPQETDEDQTSPKRRAKSKAKAKAASASDTQ